MDKNKLSSSIVNLVTENGASANSVVVADIAIMKDVVREFQAEMDDPDEEDNLVLVFHVSVIWPTALLPLHPSVQVSIRLKEVSEDEEDHEVASWERVMHKSDASGWEQSLGLIMHAVRELKLDYFIMENVESQDQRTAWLH